MRFPPLDILADMDTLVYTLLRLSQSEAKPSDADEVRKEKRKRAQGLT